MNVNVPLLPNAGMLLLCVWLYNFATTTTALALLSLLSLVVAGCYCLFNAKLPSLFTWFCCSYVGLFLVYPSVFLFLDLDLPTSHEIFALYTFCTVFGLHLFIIFYHLLCSRRRYREWRAVYVIKWSRLNLLLGFFLAVNVVAVALVLIDLGSIEMIRSRTRVEMKQHLGKLSLAAFYVLAFGAVIYPLAALKIRREKYTFFFFAPLFILFDYFLFVTFRVRTMPAIHAFGLLTGWFVLAPRVRLRIAAEGARLKTSLLQKLTVLLLVALIVLSAIVLQIYRGYYQLRTEYSEFDITLTDTLKYSFLEGGEFGYAVWVFRILDYVSENREYLYGQSYYRLLFVPIPRALWPDKPLNTQAIVAQIMFPFAPELSIPVGIIGDLYFNFGFWGILGMAVYGIVLGWLDRRNSLHWLLLAAVSFGMIFHLVRGEFTNSVLNMVMYFIAAGFAAQYLQTGKVALPLKL